MSENISEDVAISQILEKFDKYRERMLRDPDHLYSLYVEPLASSCTAFNRENTSKTND